MLFVKVVQLSVVNDRDLAVGREHRLVPAEACVEDGETRHAENDIAFLDHAAVVGPAMMHGANHRANFRAAVTAPYATNTAHSFEALLCHKGARNAQQNDCDSIRPVLAKLSRHVPESWKPFLRPPVRVVRSIAYAVSDRAELWTHKRDRLTPPSRLLRAGGFGTLSLQEHQKNGDWHVNEILVRLAGLKPHHRVLDVGCGIGQKARSLTRFLTTGSYEGLDISPLGISWCRENIAPRYPNFQFREADVYNSAYRPDGTQSAAQYKFPYDSTQFDFVILFSVFTHMMPDAVDNYLGEIFRVLKPGGTCVASFFLMGDDASKAVERGWNAHPFPYAFDGYRIFLKEKPEAAIAYDERLVRQMYERHHLTIADPILRGRWWWSDMHGQDYVIATR